MSVETLEPGAVAAAAPARSRAWGIVAALSVTETVSWGILYYAFAVFLVPMSGALGFTTAQLTGAFSLGVLVSAPAGVLAGRHLDRHSPRGLMTAGSVAGVALLIGWSQVSSLAALYALWAGMGIVMAAVLYEPAFTVLAKQFPEPAERRRAMTAMTLVGALASFIFLPLAQALIDAHGWRDALLILAVVLAVVTVPLHALVLRPAPRAVASRTPSVSAAAALRSAPFWLLSTAFFLASLTAIAITVHTIPLLIEQGHGAGFAAFAVGLIGVAQIPGRLLYAPLARSWPRPAATASVFGLVALGVLMLIALRDSSSVLAALLVLGMGNGMATLLRATAVADLYGPAAYGTIAGASAAMTTAARAAGPVAAALLAAAAGYASLLWTLAALATAAAALGFTAERLARRDHGSFTREARLVQ
jgi:MFS family permease